MALKDHGDSSISKVDPRAAWRASGHATVMALARVGAAGVGLVLLATALANMGDCGTCDDSAGPGMVPALLLGLAIPISSIYDLVDAPRAARRSDAHAVPSSFPSNANGNLSANGTVVSTNWRTGTSG